MANGDTSPSRVGQINSAGDVDALFLKKFSGEILQTFEESNVFKALHTVRTIENGKSKTSLTLETATLATSRKLRKSSLSTRCFWLLLSYQTSTT
jgi:hypothetical protein